MLRNIAIFVWFRSSVDHVALLVSRCEDRLLLCKELQGRHKQNPLRFENDADFSMCLNRIHDLESAIDEASTMLEVVEPEVMSLWTETLAQFVRTADDYNVRAIKWNKAVIKQRDSHRANKLRTFRSLLTVMRNLAEGKLASGKSELYFVRVQLFEDFSSVLEVVQRARDLKEKYKNELCTLCNVVGEPSADQMNEWMVEMDTEDDKKKRKGSGGGDDGSSMAGSFVHSTASGSRRSSMRGGSFSECESNSMHKTSQSGSMRRGSQTCSAVSGGEKEVTAKPMRFKIYKEAKQAERLSRYSQVLESVSLSLFFAAKFLFEKFEASRVDDPFAVARMTSAPLKLHSRRLTASASLSSPLSKRVSLNTTLPPADSGSDGDDRAAVEDPWGAFRSAASRRNTQILQRAVQLALEHILESLLTMHLGAYGRTSEPNSTLPDPLGSGQSPTDPIGTINGLLSKLGDPICESDVDDDGDSFYSAGDADELILPYVEVGRCLSAKYRDVQQRREALAMAGKEVKGRRALTGRDLVVARLDRANPRLPFWHAPVPPERPPGMPRVPSPLGIRPGTASKDGLETLRRSLSPRLPSAKAKSANSPKVLEKPLDS
jgi:hypothetical protein